MRKVLATTLAAGSVVAPAIAVAATADDATPADGAAPPAAAPDGISDKSNQATKLTAVHARAAARRHHVAARRAHKRAQHRAAKQSSGSAGASPTLEAIAACESGGDPHAIGGGGAFRGKYQFDYATWQSVGGSGDPAAAPAAEQDRRAAMLYAREGSTPWPVCGR